MLHFTKECNLRQSNLHYTTPHGRDGSFRQTARKILSASLYRLCNISLTPNDESFVQLRRHAILCLV